MKSIVDLSQTEINQLLLTRISELENRVVELERISPEKRIQEALDVLLEE